MAEPPDLPVTQIDLLLRYLAGQTTTAEAEDVVRWLAMQPEHAQALATLEQAFEMHAPSIAPIPEASSAEVIWNRLAARLPEDAARVDEPRPLVLPPGKGAVGARSLSSPERMRSWLRVAVVLLVAGTGFGLWQMTSSGASRSLADSALSRYHEYVTRPGERASFTLPDGTQVMLGVASRLRVPDDYGRTGREVTIDDGEAYFTVQHDPSRRFLVHTAHGVTEDLGTRFDVRDYAGDTTTQVVVVEGSVALQAKKATPPTKSMVLTAGHLGYATASGVVTVRGPVDVDPYLAWLEGRLVLRNVPLRDALPQLSRWYDLDFRLSDSTLATTGITATLTSQPIAGALDLLAVTLGVRVERRGRTITLSPQTAP